MLLELQLSAPAGRCESRQLASLLEPLGKIRVQLGQNFAASSLRAEYASDGDELGGYSTISN